MGKDIVERTKGGRVKSRKYVPHPNPVMEALECSDDEDQTCEIIRADLVTPEQGEWLKSHDLSVSDLLNGRYDVGLDNEIRAKLFGAWNAKLRDETCKASPPCHPDPGDRQARPSIRSRTQRPKESRTCTR